MIDIWIGVFKNSFNFVSSPKADFCGQAKYKLI